MISRIIVACVLLIEASVSAAERPPNIVFFLADDLGVAEVGCYGQTKIKTPNIDRLAADGMKFTRFYAGNNVCAPSRCALMTGKHAGHATIRDNKATQPEGQWPINADDVTVAELLKTKGYATGAMGKWGLGMFNTTGSPLKHGFDFFFGYNCQAHAHTHYPTYLYRNAERFEIQENDGKGGKVFSHDLFEKEALGFIHAHKAEPFFLYLPVTVPHVAVQVPEDSLAEYKGKLGDDPAYDGKKGYLPNPNPHATYAAMVTRMDRTLGRIRELLKELKLDENTLFIFTSDNGPTHNVGGADSTFFESAGKLRGLKGSMYEGGIRVPFIAAWPGKIKAGSTSDVPLYFPDVLPTFGALTGYDAPKNIDGISFLPTLLGSGEQKQHEFLYWESGGYTGQQAAIAGKWKAFRANLNKGAVKTELYDLSADPYEEHDLAAERPEELKRMEKILAEQHTPSSVFVLKAIDK